MPQDLYCPACKLAFAVGAYDVRGSPYLFHHLLVCRTCGTRHEIERPANPARSSRLVSAPGPLLLPGPPGPLGLMGGINGAGRPLRTGLLADVRRFAEDVTELTCSWCGTVGAITADFNPTETACPACKTMGVTVTAGWIT